jgi:alpha-tubulin suppressor-like RCC1 family protein
MKKIIQISTTSDELYCLTEDGKVYMRDIKNAKRHEKETYRYTSGTYYWKEIPEEENF